MTTSKKTVPNYKKIYAAKKDKQMINDINNYIDERAEEIAQDKILKAMKKLEK